MGLDDSARTWVAAACGATVVSSAAVAGGANSTIDVVELADGRSVILRRVPTLKHVPNQMPAEEIRNEAAALGLLDGVEWAPQLNAVGATLDLKTIHTRLDQVVADALRLID